MYMYIYVQNTDFLVSGSANRRIGGLHRRLYINHVCNSAGLVCSRFWKSKTEYYNIPYLYTKRLVLFTFTGIEM